MFYFSQKLLPPNQRTFTCTLVVRAQTITGLDAPTKKQAKQVSLSASFLFALIDSLVFSVLFLPLHCLSLPLRMSS